ncbi:MAG: ankyrin repeat domain-containing protein [Treponema sp.]|nr:ankyrin repeat domain-containing protein [Treponema sp.]
MKILFLHDGAGKEIAVNLLRQLEKQGIEGEAALMEGDWGSSGPPLAEILGGATHVLAVFPEAGGLNPATLPRFAFAAGFACGARLPLLIYGGEAPSLPPWSAGEPVHLRGEADFSAYLEREAKEWIRERSIQQARESLLEGGIPCTAASLGQCIGEKNLEAVKLFLRAGFSPDTRDKAGVPLICLAARAGDREITALLIGNGASVNAPAGDRGGTALIDAALGKHTDILGDLLGAGADPNAKSKDGQSALIIAVGLNDEPTVELLLKSGANVDDPDSLGVSARKYAALFNRPGMVKLFRTYTTPPVSEIINQRSVDP